MRDHTTEGRVFGDLDGQHVPVASIKRAAGPQNHALRVRVARGDSFGIEVAPLAPIRARSAARSAPRERCADGRGNPDESAAAECHVLISCKPLRMPREMLAHERRNEIITGVVSGAIIRPVSYTHLTLPTSDLV